MGRTPATPEQLRALRNRHLRGVAVVIAPAISDAVCKCCDACEDKRSLPFCHKTGCAQRRVVIKKGQTWAVALQQCEKLREAVEAFNRAD